MTYQVEFLELAVADMTAIHAWVEAEADSVIADAYLDRLKARCIALSEFAHRGTPRDDMAPGARSLSFERRILIFYRVTQKVVYIMHMVSTARDAQPLD